MYRIRRFGVMKTATVAAVMYMVVVAIFVVPFALLVAIAGTGDGLQGGLGGALVLGVVAIFGYGLLGWVFTALACLIYNLVAGWVGGIEVQVETVAPPPALPAWGTTPQPPPAAPPAPPAPPPSTSV
jgi:hypothetical protein